MVKKKTSSFLRNEKKEVKKVDITERGFEPRIFEYNSRPQFECDGIKSRRGSKNFSTLNNRKKGIDKN